MHYQQILQQFVSKTANQPKLRQTWHHRTPSQDSVTTSNDYEPCDESP